MLLLIYVLRIIFIWETSVSYKNKTSIYWEKLNNLYYSYMSCSCRLIPVSITIFYLCIVLSYIMKLKVIFNWLFGGRSSEANWLLLKRESINQFLKASSWHNKLNMKRRAIDINNNRIINWFMFRGL